MFTRIGSSVFLALFSLALPALSTAATIDHVEIFEGRVALARSGEFDLIVTIDHFPKKGNGIADQAFVVRSSIPLPSELHDFNEMAQLVVRRESVVILRSNNRDIVFTVTPGEESQNTFVAAKRQHALFIDTAYQITHFYDDSGGDPESRASASVIPHLFADKFIEAGECDDGGPGNEECSGNGCSVTCGSGYFACCTSEGCHCEGAN